MDKMGLRKECSVSLRIPKWNKRFQVAVESLDLSADITELARLICDKPAIFRATELATRMTPALGDFAAVYVIGPEEGDCVKIGYASDPRKRLSSLQIGNWHELHIHALLWVDQGPAYLEKIALSAAKEMGWHIRGEWMEANPTDAAELILKAARYDGFRCYDSEAWIDNWPHRLDAFANAKGLSKRLIA